MYRGDYEPYVIDITNDYEPVEEVGKIEMEEVYEAIDAGNYLLDEPLSSYDVRIAPEYLNLPEERLRYIFSLSDIKWEFFHKKTGKALETEYIPRCRIPIFASLYIERQVDKRLAILGALEGVIPALKQANMLISEASKLRD